MPPQASSGASAWDQFRFAYYEAPPIARTLTTAIVVISWSSMVLSILPFGWLYFSPSLVFRWRTQFWRLVTPFFVSGPKLSLLLDPYFFYHYCSLMERDSPRFTLPGDLAVFFMFVGYVSMAITYNLWFSMLYLRHVTMALVYMYSQDEPEQIITFIVVKIRRKYLPYCMLLLTLLLNGPISMLDETCGLIAGHMYNFITKLWPEYGGGVDLLPTPAFLRRWFAKPVGSATQRRYGTAFQATAPRYGNNASRPSASGASSSTGSSWTSGFTSSGSWGSRGQGRRLGGD